MRMSTKWQKGILKTLAVCCACALAAACVPIPSLHPLYTEEDLVMDAYFAGRWVEADSNETVWTIEEKPNKEYRLTISDPREKEELEFELHLVKLGSFVFLDARQKDPNDGFFLRLHLLGRIEIDPDEVRISLLDDDWVKEQLKAGRLNLRHEETDEGILLTADTKELQNLVVIYALDEQAFSHKTTLERLYPDRAQ